MLILRLVGKASDVFKVLSRKKDFTTLGELVIMHHEKYKSLKGDLFDMGYRLGEKYGAIGAIEAELMQNKVRKNCEDIINKTGFNGGTDESWR